MAEIKIINGKKYIRFDQGNYYLIEDPLDELEEDDYLVDEDEIDENNGKPTIRIGGKEYQLSQERSEPPSKSKKDPMIKQRELGIKSCGNQPGTAPYNFIDLPHEPKPAADNNRNHDSYDSALLHGHIDYDLKTLTPLMIRGEQEHFFQVNGNPTIPGSSIRGMISTLVEILSESTFQNFNNRRVFQREMLPTGFSGFDYYYEKRQGYFEKELSQLVGFIKFDRSTREYSLRTSDEITCADEDKGREKEFSIHYREGGNGRVAFSIYPGNMSSHKYEISTSLEFKDETANNIHPILIEDITDFQNDTQKKVSQSNREQSYGDPIYLAKYVSGLRTKPGSIFEAYQKYGVPIFYSTWEDENKEQPRHMFGHTRNFRIPYHKTVSDHIPEVLQDAAFIDFKRTLFGDTDQFAGKLQFEDLSLKNPDPDAFLETEICKVLATPKSSYYPAYLKQPDSIRTTREGLHNWGTEGAEIRGYKFYHHINRDDYWMEEKIRINQKHIREFLNQNNHRHKYGNERQIITDLAAKPRDSFLETSKKFSQFSKKTQALIRQLVFNQSLKLPQQFTLLSPLKRNQTFKGGRIRFANLSEEELGLLLLALELHGKARHKLGYAKPYGLGSVRIEKIKVALHNRQKRYQKVFYQNKKFYEGLISKDQRTQIRQDSKNALFKYFGCKDEAAFWNLPRNQGLLKMLEWKWEENDPSTSKWIEQTAYMKMGKREKKKGVKKREKEGYSEKRILPTIDEFYQGTKHLK